MKRQVLDRYRRNIRLPINLHKEESLQYFSRRKDIDMTGIAKTIAIQYKNKSDEEIVGKTEHQSSMRRVKKLEKKIENLTHYIAKMFRKYDNHIKEL
jgi:hypothetical protein